MSSFGRYFIGSVCLCFAIAAAYSGQSGKTIVTRVAAESGAVGSPSDSPASPAADAGGAMVSSLAARFGEAAAENARLGSAMSWAFGGKTQRGVQIYLPLICRLIGAEGEFGQPEFAEALARWQQSVGLAPRGVLDDETWRRIVATWQGHRTREFSVAPPERLVLVPAESFYDPERPAELRYVERETYDAYRRLLAAAIADPEVGLRTTETGALAPDEKFLKIISAFRSPEYQAQLRRQSPGAGRAALAVHSPHSTGRALDLYVGGEPVITKDTNRALQTRTKAYQWLVKHADEFGFYPYFYEPWHWEYKPLR